MRRAIAATALLLLLCEFLSGCTQPNDMTIRIECDAGVSYRAFYRLRYRNGGDGLGFDGSGNWELTVPTNRKVIVGALIEVTRYSGEGTITVTILRGDEVLAQNQAVTPGESARCTWGTP